MSRFRLYWGLAFILLSSFIFSTMEVMLKLPVVSGVFHPMQITFARFFVGGLALLPFALYHLKKHDIKITTPYLKTLFLTGLLCVPLSMVLFQLAITYGHANVVAVLFSGNPIFVTVLAFLFLHETIRWNNVLALVFNILGIIAIINPFSPETDINLLSVFFILLSAILFSSYSVLGKRVVKHCGSIVVTCFSFLFGSAQLLFLLILGKFDVFSYFYQQIGLSIFRDVPLFTGINTVTLPYFLYICLVNTALGYIFHMLAMEYTNVHMTNLIFFFKPILAPLLAYFVLHEQITANITVGIVFFLTGSLLGIIPALLRHYKEEKINLASSATLNQS